MRQHKILQVIRDSVERRGYPPSVREIGQAAGLKSPSSVAHQLKVLEKRGLLRRDPNRPRAVDIRPMEDVMEESPSSRRRPMFRWSAGSPPAGRSWPSRRSRTSSRCRRTWSARARCSCCKVVGDSMIDAAITDGDWVVVRQQPVADNGDIVAAMIDGEATVKTFRRKDGHVLLMPHNAAYEPIPGDDAVDPGPSGHGAAQALSRQSGGRPVPHRASDIRICNSVRAHVFVETLGHRDDRRPSADPRHQPRKRSHLFGAAGIEIDHHDGRIGHFERVALFSEPAGNHRKLDRRRRAKGRTHRIVELRVGGKNHHAGSVRVGSSSNPHDVTRSPAYFTGAADGVTAGPTGAGIALPVARSPDKRWMCRCRAA